MIDVDVRLEITQLVHDLRARPADPDSVTEKIVSSALRYLPEAHYAGITTVHRGGLLGTAAAIGPYPGMLDIVQQRHREGPCLDAARDVGIVQVNDLRTDARWPAYRRETLQRTPIRSVLSVALVSDEEVLGALNVFSETPRAFDAEAVDIAQFFAINAALAWSSERREMRYCRSRDSHDIVGQAEGRTPAQDLETRRRRVREATRC